MKIKLLFSLIALSGIETYCFAQEAPLLVLESGIMINKSTYRGMGFIREDFYPSRLLFVPSSNLTSLSYKTFAGVRYESSFIHPTIRISTGVRFSQTLNSIHTDFGYFYMLARQDGLNTEYVRGQEIRQNSNYIGIPLEGRYFPLRRDAIQMFFKFGFEVFRRLETRNDVTFSDPAMSVYRDDILAKLSMPDRFNGSVYGGMGIRYGKPFKPSIGLELTLPAIFFKETFGIVNQNFGRGIQLHLYWPLLKKPVL
jgi:hypothetical protein